MKVCKKCSLQLEESGFYRNHDECKKCWNKYCSDRRNKEKEKDPNFLEKRREYLRIWREKNKDKEKEYLKRSFEKNKEKVNERRRTPERRKVNNEAVKTWRKNNPERFKETEKLRRKNDRKKELARSLIYKHIVRGHMDKGEECEICKARDRGIEAHHEDYNKPLEVRWLCNICHRQQHNKLMDVKP